MLYNQTFVHNTALLSKADEGLLAYITLGSDYLICAVFNRDKSCLYFLKTIYKEKGNIGKEEFDDLLSKIPFRKIANVFVAIDTPKHTLIPVQYLVQGDKKLYFKHLHEIEGGEEILQQKVNDDIEELYVVKKTTLAYLKNEFKQYTVFSQSACILYHYTRRNDFSKNHTIFIHVTPSAFYFTLFQYRQLYLHQSFDLISADDILYCTLNGLQVHGLDIENCQIHLSGFSERLEEIYQHLQPYFHLSLLAKETDISGDEQWKGMPAHYVFHLYSLISCAS